MIDENALFKLTHGLYVLGASDNGRFVGSIIDAVMQAACKPYALCVSCTNTSYTKYCIDNTGVFSLSILPKSSNPNIISNFGFQSSRHINKWDNVEFFEKDKLPFLTNNLAQISCKVIDKKVFESNTVFIAEVTSAFLGNDGDALTYNDYRTYFKQLVLENYKMTDKTEDKKSNHEAWKCTVCDYVYDEEKSFESLPEDWLCPVCGVGKEFFVKL